MTPAFISIICIVIAGIFAAIAMGDQGIVMGFTAGRKIAGLIEGKQDEFLEMASPKRFNI